jgi:hypothetical protein
MISPWEWKTLAECNIINRHLVSVLSILWLNYPTIFLHFCDYLSLEKDLALYLNKLQFSLSKDNFYQVWLKLINWFLERRFPNIFCVFLLLCYHPHKRRVPSLISTNLNSLPQDNSCQVWLKFASDFGGVVANTKVYRQTHRLTDDGGQAIRISHLRFKLGWADKKNKNKTEYFLYFSWNWNWAMKMCCRK